MIDNGTEYDWTFTYVIVNKMSAQNYKVIFEDDTREFVADTTNLFTSVSHSLMNTDAIRFSSLGTTVGTYSIIFAANTTYYVTNSTVNTFKISPVSGGNPIDITNAGTCTGVNQGTESNFAASTDDKFTLTSHGLADGDTIEFSSLGTTVGTYSATFAINTTYYVTNSTANTFKISHVSNGAEIDITTAGSCTASYPDNDGGTGTSWKSYLGFTDTSYNLLSSIANDYTSQVVADEDVYVDPNKTITIDASNNSFLFSPYSTIKGLYAQDNTSEINIVVPNGTYGVYQLYNELNNIFNLTPETNGTLMYSNFDAGWKRINRTTN